MSDSEWEVLSASSYEQTPQPLQTSSTASTLTAGGALEEGNVRQNARCDSMSKADYEAMLIPLCLTLNQTGTRIGVGHTRGFLVFRVAAASVADSAHEPGETVSSATTPAASPWVPEEQKRSAKPAQGAGEKTTGAMPMPPAHSQLLLDPQYNVDLLTFSNIRERMRQQRFDKDALPTPATSTTAEATVSAQRAVVTEGVAHSDCTYQCVSASEDSLPPHADGLLGNDRDNTTDSFGELSSFLTTAGHAFAQIKRDRRNLCVRTGRAVAVSSSLQQQPNEKLMSGAKHAAAAPVMGVTTSTFARECSHRTGSNAPAETLPMCDEANLPQSRAPPLNSSLVLEGDKNENIHVDPSCMDASNHDDVAPVVMKQKDSLISSSSTSLTLSVASEQGEDPGVEENEEDYIGFEGGGVAVMAFLYEQTWMALVGGGPTPMGEPQCVQFVRDGEWQHRLLMPDPVVHLFLDARLLFVVTTTELRMYTNPIERDWACLRQSLPISAAVAARYTVAFPPAAVNASLRVWGKVPNPGWAQSAADTVAALEAAEEHRESCGTPAAAVSLPVIPVVVDYARNLVLLPTGEEGNGFALYRYVSGPEVQYPNPVAASDTIGATGSPSQHLNSESEHRFSTGSIAVATGRTTCFLQHIATRPTAHRNPLYNLALYVGWPASITRLLSSDEVGKSNQTNDSSENRDLHVTSSGGLVTLVAAASEYATRLTLWILQKPQQEIAALQEGCSPSSLAATTAEAAFVLLREFRVGMRLTAPRVVMASLPGVSRYATRSHTTLAEAPDGAATGFGDGRPRTESETNARPLRNRSSAGDKTMAPRTATSGLPSDIVTQSTPHSSFVYGIGATTSWASGAAGAVASSRTGPMTVQHLQFIGNGAYLLCIHGTDIISIFSTSARETAQEARNMCKDRVAAEHNRYSRLSMMHKYLPQVLSSRLEAYTRQAWSSCSGRLPSSDPTFLPRWICAQSQGIPISSQDRPAPSHGTSIREKELVPTRSTSTVESRPPTEAPAMLPSDSAKNAALAGADEDKLNAHTPAEGLHLSSRTRSSRVSAAGALRNIGDALAFSPWSPEVQPRRGSGDVWGTPLAELPQCLRLWSAAPLTGGDTAWMCGGTTPSASSSRHPPPIVLNCATCEGAFANIVLYAEEGEVRSSQVVRYGTV